MQLVATDLFIPSNIGVVLLDLVIVTRSGEIVWKHGPNELFHALMLRTKPFFQNPFFSTVHQNINRVLFSFQGFIRVFSFLCQNTNMPRSKFVKKNVAACQRNKLALYKTQNGGPNQQIIKFFYTILLGASYTIRVFKYYRAD